MAPQRGLTGYGVARREGRLAVVARVGDGVIDLATLAADHGLEEATALAEPTLNPFMALGSASWERVAAFAAEIDAESLGDVDLVLPFEVADFVDFYASEHHATNLGRILRPGQEPLVASWRHHPLGYHGRAGTVVVSGTPVIRPWGPRRGDPPVYGPSEHLDVEAEIGFVVGVPSALGTPVGVEAFADHVFGVCVVNDWSARDIQAWEQAPLGPFLGKSFLTSVSPWIVPLARLAAARIPPPARPVPPLEHLAGESCGYDIALEIRLNGHVVSRPPFASMYWTPAELLAHLTANGAWLRTGDLFASGTVSGPEPDQVGSLIERSQGFLEDGDEVVISARAADVDLGFVVGRVSASPAPRTRRSPTGRPTLPG